VTGFDVHPPSLREAGQGLQDAAERVATAWQTLQGAVQGMGEMFGDDMVSSLIAMTYGAAQDMAAESYASAAEGLAGFGAGLSAMADVYETVEEANTATVDDLGRAM
jgi:Excreted virulence factor EspC, type VII ESX diderm